MKLAVAGGVVVFVAGGALLGRLVLGPLGLAWGILITGVIGLVAIFLVQARFASRPSDVGNPRFLGLTQRRLLMLEGDPRTNQTRADSFTAFPLGELRSSGAKASGSVRLVTLYLPSEALHLLVPQQFEALADALARLGSPSGTMGNSGRA